MAAEWSTSDTLTAVTMWKAGKSAAEISVELGSISRSAVTGKMHRLKLASGKEQREKPKKPPIVEAGRKGGFNPNFNIPPVRSAPASAKAWLPLPGSNPMSLLDAGNRCKWPIGHDPILACCEVRSNGHPSYCEAHRTIARKVVA
jgi:GcrA cell cycle regulator